MAIRYPTFLLLFLSVFAASTSYAATLTVTKIEDTNDGVCDSDCSLREAVGTSGSGDTIVFSELFNSPHTITLQLGEMLVILKRSYLCWVRAGQCHCEWQ